MGETNPRQIWAILAPLAAMAGLIFYMRRRRNPGKFQLSVCHHRKMIFSEEQDTVKHVVREMKVAEKESGLNKLEEVEVENDIDSGMATMEPEVTEVIEPVVEAKVEQTLDFDDRIPEPVEESAPESPEEIVEEKVQVQISEPIAKSPKPEIQVEPEVVPEPSSEPSPKQSPEPSPVPPVEQVVETSEPVVEDAVIEKEEVIEVLPLTTTIETGVSGILSQNRFRTESERRECEDWTNSPKPAVRYTTLVGRRVLLTESRFERPQNWIARSQTLALPSVIRPKRPKVGTHGVWPTVKRMIANRLRLHPTRPRNTPQKLKSQSMVRTVNSKELAK